MGDVPIKPSTAKTKRKASKEAAALRAELQTVQQENEKLKAGADDGPIATLEPQELAELLNQKHVLERAHKEAEDAIAEAKRTQAVLVMLRTAYNLRWTDVQKKHGLPADMDMNWASGEAFRKKSRKG